MRPMFNHCINTVPGGPMGPQPPNGPLAPQNGPQGDIAFFNAPPPPHFAGPAHPPPPPFGNIRPAMGAMPPHPHAHGPPQPGRPAFFNSPDFKMFEMNKRLHNRNDDCDNIWWDSFASEFFEDDASLTLSFCLEDGPKRFTIGRPLIPRYFRSIFDGGVHDLSFQLKFPKESFNPPIITLDCEQCTMVTRHGKPGPNKIKDHSRETSAVVCTEGRLILEFCNDEMMRIRSWHFSTRHHHELVLRSLVIMQAQQQDPALLEQLTMNITRQGIPSSTLNYLRLCVILEPMQLLMSRHKALVSVNPRDCLKHVLYDKWQRMVGPPEAQRPPNKRRKRKTSAAGAGNTNTTGGQNKKKNSVQMSPGTPNFSLASQDVMVVGEPSLMGGEFGEEDERIITRLENTQYEGNVVGPNGMNEEPVDEFGGHNAGTMVQPINGPTQQTSSNSGNITNNVQQSNSNQPQSNPVDVQTPNSQNPMSSSNSNPGSMGSNNGSSINSTLSNPNTASQNESTTQTGSTWNSNGVAPNGAGGGGNVSGNGQMSSNGLNVSEEKKSPMSQ